MKRAIVTGASGFIGGALVRELSVRGVRVLAVVREREKAEKLIGLSGVEVAECDMARLERLPERLDGPADVFFHMAWQGAYGQGRADYGLQLLNAKWTADAVRAAHAAGCGRFVGAGTLMELEAADHTMQDGAVPDPSGGYGAAKAAAHYMSKAECGRLGMEHLWAYVPNTYGVGNHTPSFINAAVRAMLAGQPGDFTAGTHMYDFVYIDDTVRGLCCIGGQGRPGCSYYIGGMRPRPLRSFIETIRDEVDPSLQPNFGAVPFYGVAYDVSVFDCGKLTADTGYRPRVPFEQGIRKTAAWLRQERDAGAG